MKRNLIALFLLSMLVCPSSWAGFQQGSQSLSLNVGGAFPLTDIDFSSQGTANEKIGTPGYSLGGQYLYGVAPQVGLGLDVNFTQFGENDSNGFPLQTAVQTHSTVVLAVAKYSFLPDGNFLPYALLGFGAHVSSLKLSAAPGAGLVWLPSETNEQRTFIDDSGSSFAFALGTGFDVPINERLFLGAEVRYQYLGSVTYEANVQPGSVGGTSGAESMVNIVGHIGYKF